MPKNPSAKDLPERDGRAFPVRVMSAEQAAACRTVDAELGPGERELRRFRLAHSSEPNPRRRVPFCPPRARPARGEGWRGRPDPFPEREPVCLDYCNALLARCPETRSEAERKAVG